MTGFYFINEEIFILDVAGGKDDSGADEKKDSKSFDGSSKEFFSETDPLMGSIIRAGETGAATATGGTATTATTIAVAGVTTTTTTIGPGESGDEYADSLLEITRFVCLPGPQIYPLYLELRYRADAINISGLLD